MPPQSTDNDSSVYAVDGRIVDIVIVVRKGPQPHILEENGGFVAGGSKAEADLREFIEMPIIIGEIAADQHARRFEGVRAAIRIDTNAPHRVVAIIFGGGIRRKCLAIGADGIVSLAPCLDVDTHL